MVDAALQSGTADRRVRVRGVRPAPAGRPALRRRRRHRSPARADRSSSASRDAELAWLRDNEVVRCRHPRLARRLPLQRRASGLPRGRALLPRLAAARRRGHLRRGGHPRDPHPERAELRLRRSRPPPRAWCSAAVGRPLAEMGSRRTGEYSAVAAARAAYIAGFAATSNLEAGRTLGHSHDGHRRALLHPAARQRGRGVPRAGRRDRRRHHPARRHLRHRERRRDAPSRSPAPSSAPSASTPATCRPSSAAARAPARRARRRQHPHHRHQRPRRVRDRRPVRRPPSTRTVSAPRSSPGRAPRPPAWSTSSSPTPNDAGDWVSVAKTSAAKASVGGRKDAVRRLDATGTAREEIVLLGDGPAGEPELDSTCGRERALARPAHRRGRADERYLGARAQPVLARTTPR